MGEQADEHKGDSDNADDSGEEYEAAVGGLLPCNRSDPPDSRTRVYGFPQQFAGDWSRRPQRELR